MIYGGFMHAHFLVGISRRLRGGSSVNDFIHTRFTASHKIISNCQYGSNVTYMVFPRIARPQLR